MAEQSHKREMRDALRGDFERLRARRERGRRAESKPVPPERIVLTPPSAAVAHAPVVAQDAAPAPVDAPPAEAPRRSWLGILRRW